MFLAIPEEMLQKATREGKDSQLRSGEFSLQRSLQVFEFSLKRSPRSQLSGGEKIEKDTCTNTLHRLFTDFYRFLEVFSYFSDTQDPHIHVLS